MYRPRGSLIYYNLSAYVSPSCKESNLELKKSYSKEQLLPSRLPTLVEVLQKRHPHKAECIYHYPLGVVDSYLNPQPEKPPSTTVGYVGNSN